MSRYPFDVDGAGGLRFVDFCRLYRESPCWSVTESKGSTLRHFIISRVDWLSGAMILLLTLSQNTVASTLRHGLSTFISRSYLCSSVDWLFRIRIDDPAWSTSPPTLDPLGGNQQQSRRYHRLARKQQRWENCEALVWTCVGLDWDLRHPSLGTGLRLTFACVKLDHDLRPSKLRALFFQLFLFFLPPLGYHVSNLH